MPLSQCLRDVCFSLGMLPVPFFLFLILRQLHSLGISPTWTSPVKEMRVERVRGRGTGSVLNLCVAKWPKITSHHLLESSCLVSEAGLPRQRGEAGLELKMILINQRRSQEQQEGVHQDKSRVQLSKHGAGRRLNKSREKLER